MPLVVDTEPLDRASDARAADAFTIERLGVSGDVLMEHAGRAVAHRARALAAGGAVVVVCGPGNNGGDGHVAARHLAQAGVPVVVATTVAADALSGDARTAADRLLRATEALRWTAPSGGPLFVVVDDAPALHAILARERPTVVVDALFGAGLARPIEGAHARLVDLLSLSNARVLAVDVSSGLPSDGAAPTGAVVVADETITFDRRKIAHASEPGRALSGRVTVVDIGLARDPARPTSSISRVVRARAVEGDRRAERARSDVHKGAFGHVGVASGTTSTEGAAVLSAHAALRAGAGLVSLVGPRAVLAPPEIMRRVSDDARALVAGLDALVVGPGLGLDDEAAARARALVAAAASAGAPVVVDADALAPLADAGVAAPAVFTPHPGEAARLLGTTTRSVQSDRIAAVTALGDMLGKKLGKKLGGQVGDTVVVLKGACPLVHARGEGVFVVEGGTPALAVAGSGDVLAGLIGALLARGERPLLAALVGVVVHQAAGRACALRSPRGHLASEIALELPALLARLTDDAGLVAVEPEGTAP